MKGTLAIVLVLVLVGCASGVAATEQQLPPPPGALADRVGVYAWGFDDSAWPGSPDRLAWATSKITALGARVARVALSPTIRTA